MTIEEENTTISVAYFQNASVQNTIKSMDVTELSNADSNFTLQDAIYARTWNEEGIIKIVMTCVYASIFFSGTAGNIIFCVVLIRNKVLHTATNFYLWSMSCSDLFVIFFGLPYDFYSLWSQNAFFGKNYAIFHSLLLELSTNASILTITVFTIERYIGICHPLRSQTMSQLGRVPKIIIAIWIISFLTTIPVIIIHPSLYEGEKVYDPELAHTFIIFSFVCLFTFPLLIITFLYARIIIELKRSEKIANSQPSIRDRSGADLSKELIARNRDVIRVLVAVVVSFFLCFSPFESQRLLSVFGDQHQESVFFLLRVLTHVSGIFLYLSTCMNPILYHIMSDRFRKAMWATFSCSSSRSSRLNLSSHYKRTERRRNSSFQVSRTTGLTELPSTMSAAESNFVSCKTEIVETRNEINSRHFMKWLKNFNENSSSVQPKINNSPQHNLVSEKLGKSFKSRENKKCINLLPKMAYITSRRKIFNIPEEPSCCIKTSECLMRVDSISNCSMIQMEDNALMEDCIQEMPESILAEEDEGIPCTSLKL